MNLQLFKIAARNLSRNRRRNIATGSALGLGFAGLLAITGFHEQVEHNLRAYTVYGNRTGHVVIYKHEGLEKFETNPQEYGLDERDLQAIKRITAEIPEIEYEGAQLIGPGLVSNGCQSMPFYAMGIDPELDRRLQQHPYNLRWNGGLTSLKKGRELWAYSAEEPVIMLSSGLATLVGKTTPRDPEVNGGSSDPIDCAASDLNDRLNADSLVQLAGYSWNGMMTGTDASVTGIFATSNAYFDSAAARLPLAQLQKLYGTRGATSYAVWLKDERDIPSVMLSLRSKLSTSGLNLDVFAWNDPEVSPHYDGMSKFILTVTGFIATIIAAVVALSVSNSATMTIIERAREVGMMRSLGFTRRWIRILFVAEISCVAFVALISGAVFGFLMISGLNALGLPLDIPGIISGLKVRMLIDQGTISRGGIAIFALAVASALYAVWRVAKNNIAYLLTGTHR